MFVLEMSQVMQGENGEKGHDHVGLIGFGVGSLNFILSAVVINQRDWGDGRKLKILSDGSRFWIGPVFHLSPTP